MKRGVPSAGRSAQLDYISTHLLRHAAVVTRLLTRDLNGGISRTEAGVLRTLLGGPRRITELAELEGLAQPTMTLLVKRLEAQGLVRRERQDHDQRVVEVSLTDAGRQAFDNFLELVQAALRGYLEEAPDEQLEALAVGTEALEGLIASLLGDGRVRDAAA